MTELETILLQSFERLEKELIELLNQRNSEIEDLKRRVQELSDVLKDYAGLLDGSSGC